MPRRIYGYELVLDLSSCNPVNFTRRSIEEFMIDLCQAIDMKRCRLFWWDDEGLPLSQQQINPYTKGTSAVQFIITSNVTIHTLDLLRCVFINVFSCKKFSKTIAKDLACRWFEAGHCRSRFMKRIFVQE